MLDMVRKMVDLYDKKLKMRRIFFLLVADGGSSQVATRLTSEPVTPRTQS